MISAILEALLDKFIEASKTAKIVTIGVLVVALIAIAPPAYRAVFPERSARAFCAEYNKEKQAYLDKYNRNPGEGVAAFTQLMGAVSALPQLFDRLAKHAPDEIQSDVLNIRDTLKAQQQVAIDNAGNPLGGLVASMATGMMSANSWERVGQFVEDNCVTAEERQQRAQAQAAAVEQVETDQARSNLESAMTALDNTLGQELDLEYTHYFDSVEEAKGYAKETLRDYRDRIANAGDYCDESVWSDAGDMAQIDWERGKQNLENLQAALNSTEDLERDSGDLRTAADTLRAIDPAAPELKSADDKLAEAAILIGQIETANEEAVAKMKDRIKVFDDYLADAKKLAKTKC